MPGARPRLTPKLIRDLVERIKAGAYEEVAAESLGVPIERYKGWLERGQDARARGIYRQLFEAVRQARAHARFMAEMDLRTKAPKVWLLNGPGRETRDLPGWTAPAKPRPDRDRELNVFEHPEIIALLNLIRETLVPFADAFAALVQVAPELAPPGTK